MKSAIAIYLAVFVLFFEGCGLLPHTQARQYGYGMAQWR